MKSTKRRFAAVSVLAALLLTGCSGADQKPAGTSADSNGKLEISWAGNVANPSGQEGGWIETMLEEKYNMELKPIFMDTNAYKTKRPITFSGGDIADVIYEADPVDLQRDAAQGFLMEFSLEDMKKYAPDYYNFINEHAYQAWAGCTYNGKIYGFPSTRILSNYPNTSLWRMDWLKKLGIDKVPETIDDFHTALEKITKEDPDGNGQNDTFGMTGDFKNWYSAFTEIFGAYGALPFNWIEKDGEIVWGATQPETREALATLRQWYSEGLIHPDFVTDGTTPEIIKNKFANGEVGYISGTSYRDSQLDYPTSPAAALKKLNPETETVVGIDPKGPQGKQGRFAWGAGGNIYCFGRQVKDEPEKVKRILTMFNDMITNDEFYIQSKSGKQGEHWEYNDASVGKASGIKAIAPYDQKEVAERNILMYDPTYVSYWSPSGGTLDILQMYMNDNEKAYYEKNARPELAMKDVFMKPDVVPSSSRYINDLRNYQLTTFAEIISGQRELDYYDTFLEEWNKRGGEQFTKDANDFYKEVDSVVYEQIKK